MKSGRISDRLDIVMPNRPQIRLALTNAVAALAVIGGTLVGWQPAQAKSQTNSTSPNPQTSALKRPTAKKTPARASASAKKTTASTSAAARRRARARAAARARRARELATPRFKLDGSGHQVPAPRAAASIIYDPETNEVLFEEASQELRSIASITKVMTALVYLESSPDLARVVKVERADVARASTTYLRAGYAVSIENLLHLLLIGSDNAAARVLARVSSYGAEGFIARMNQKARELGLEQTHYEGPSGLLSANVSSAFEMARLIAYAAADERIGGVMRKSEHSFRVGKRTIHVKSTNRLLRTGELDVLGGKTGFINSSGYCLATLVRLPQTGRQVALVVLGAKSSAGRFAEIKHLFNWLSSQTAIAGGPADSPQGQ